MKIILKKGAMARLYVGKSTYTTIVCDRDVVFQKHEVVDLKYNRRSYIYYPRPLYNGQGVYSIEWDINDINEQVILEAR